MSEETPKGMVAWFTTHPVAANLLAFSILVGGFLTLPFVRKEVFPEISPSIVTVTVPYLGATPVEVERGVCMRIEEAVEGVTGVDKVSSVALEGAGVVTVEALQEADLEQVLDDVKARVDAITNFPKETEEPVISRLVVRKEVISVAIRGSADERTLKTLGERARDTLTTLPGITQVELYGVRPYEVSVEVSEDRLQQHGLTFDEVAAAVRRSSLDLPAGSIKAESGQTLIRAQAQAYTGTDFEQLVVLSKQDGTRVTLGEVATVVDGFADDDLLARFDGEPAVLLKVFRVGDQDALQITQSVRDWVAGDGKSMLPEGVTMSTWRDESVILRGRIELLLRNAAQGFVLVLLLLALFLQLRLALWVGFGIPVAFMGAVMLMPALDVSINLISLFSFLLVLGIVVDDAIVVGENVFEHRKRSESPRKAALLGSHEVAVPVIASVLTTVAAFLPMFNVPGSDAQIWRVIPLIVIPVLLFSLVESKLVLPAHLASIPLEQPGKRSILPVRAWESVQRAFQRSLDWFIAKAYQPACALALRWRYLTIASAVAAMLVTAATVVGGTPRFVFFPTVDGDNIVVTLVMPQGTPVERTSGILGRIERIAADLGKELDTSHPHGDRPLFQHMLATVGEQPYAVEQARNAGQRDAQGASGSHLAELNIQLLPSELRTLGSESILTMLRERVGPVADATELSFTSSLFTTGKDVDVELYHEDMDVLRAAAADLKTLVARYPAVLDVSDSYKVGKEELKLRIKPTAEALGLTQQDLARQVRQAFYGEEAQRVQRGRDDVRVMVRYPEAGRKSLQDLETMRIRTPQGAEVPFAEVAEVERSRSYSSIQRVDRKRVIRIGGQIDEGDPAADAEAVNRDLRTSVLPALVAQYNGLSWGFEGDQKKRRELLAGLGAGFALALFAIYALIAVPLNSYLQPVLIMTAIPFGLVGAVAGHMITGFDLSILSLFGVVALAGVVVNDNIVLVDWVNQERGRHHSLLDAVRSAGAQRFRPIMLTSLTTFGGLAPLLMEKSLQARFLIPMAISLGFGVMFATLVSLFLVPAMYLVLEDIRNGWNWLYGRRPAVQAGPTTEPTAATQPTETT